MKNNIANVSLSFCCKEDWNSFETIDERNKFCASCQHRVVDFTNASAGDFANAKKAGSLCGRFKRSQLSAAFLLGMAASGSISSCTEPEIATPPQTPPPIEIEQFSEEEEFLTGIVFIRDSTDVENDSIATEGDIR